MWNKQVNDIENVMGKMKVCLLVLSALLILILVPVVSAEEQIIKITYISYTPNEALEMASETNDYSNLIEYTFINYYNATSNGISDEILEAAETGFLETQDVIVCDHIGSTILNDLVINETMRNAHDSGTELYTIKTMGTPPEYFDYISDGSANDPICNYYNNLGTEGEGLESAERLLIYLATNGPNLLRTAILDNASVNFNNFVFVLGTEYNEVTLSNAALDANISAELNIKIFTKNDTVPEDFDFSEYGMIFIESQDENTTDKWTTSIKAARTAGAKVIGYNLSSNIALSNVDLYSDEYTDIERYWVQGGETNMKSMLKFMGQNFSGLWGEMKSLNLR